MNKTEVIKSISKSTSVDEATVRIVVNALSETIFSNLIKGINVHINGFIHFTLGVKKERTIVVPTTQEEYKIPKRYSVKVALPRDFKDRINKKEVH